MGAFEQRAMDCHLNLMLRLFRERPDDFIDRFAGKIGQPDNKIGAFEADDSAGEIGLIGCIEDETRRALRQCRRAIGRKPFTLARIAEPLLMSAVVAGDIRPPGSARARAAVFSTETMP